MTAALSAAGCQVVLTARSAAELLRQLVAAAQPDVLVLEKAEAPEAANLPLHGGLCREPSTAVVLLTNDDHLAEKQGVAALPQNCDPSDLVATVRARAGVDDRSTVPNTLTRRELEILSLASRGLPSNVIAKTLFISTGTVKLHLHHIYEKLGVSNRAAAIAAAIGNGLITARPASSEPKLSSEHSEKTRFQGALVERKDTRR